VSTPAAGAATTPIHASWQTSAGTPGADIVAFSSAGVYESLATAGGALAAPTFELAAFGTNAGGWSSDNTYPREVADVNGDAEPTSSASALPACTSPWPPQAGIFAAPTFELACLRTNAGGWSSDNTYPRALADVNGDGRADIVGFSSAGVYESLATAGGHFAAPNVRACRLRDHRRRLDQPGPLPAHACGRKRDGKADIVGFGADGVYVSLATGGGHFAAPTFQLSAFGANARRLEQRQHLPAPAGRHQWGSDGRHHRLRCEWCWTSTSWI